MVVYLLIFLEKNDLVKYVEILKEEHRISSLPLKRHCNKIRFIIDSYGICGVYMLHLSVLQDYIINSVYDALLNCAWLIPILISMLIDRK